MSKRVNKLIPIIAPAVLGDLRYYRKVKNLFGTSLIGYWPLWEAAGTTINDISGNSRNGTSGGSVGPTFGVAGVGDGKTAISFPGANAYINVFSTSLRDAFNAGAGTYMLWLKGPNWADATTRSIFRLDAGAGNTMYLRRPASTNSLNTNITAGGTSVGYTISSGLPTSNWIHIAVTWDFTADEFITYKDAVALSTQGSLGTWAVQDLSTTLIGATTTGPVQVFDGTVAHVLMLNRVATPTEVAHVQSFFA